MVPVFGLPGMGVHGACLWTAGHGCACNKHELGVSRTNASGAGAGAAAAKDHKHAELYTIYLHRRTGSFSHPISLYWGFPQE